MTQPRFTFGRSPNQSTCRGPRVCAALGALVLIATLAIGGCSDLSLYDLLGGERGGNLTPVATAVNLEVSTTFPAGASGGFAPYTFSVFGSEAPAHGTVDPASGLYTAPAALPVGESFTTDTVVIADYVGTKVSMTVRSFGRLRATPQGATVDVDNDLVLTISGGVPPYAADVADETGTPVTTRGTISVVGDIADFAAPDEPGKSLVIVSDEIGNETVVTIHVIDPLGPLAITPPTATIELDDFVVFSISGGTVPYTTTLDPPGFGSIVDPLTATPRYNAPAGPEGVAQITVTDNDGATATATVYVVAAAPDELVIAPALVEIQPDHSATFTVSGGTPGYSYSLQPERGSFVVSGSTVVYTAAGNPGNVRLNVTDQFGQEASATIRVRN